MRSCASSCARAGRRTLCVPLVAESEDAEEGVAAASSTVTDMRAATAELERLRKGELKDHRLVLLHGGMKSREKAGAMARFASGAADVLVATTVIEVGIDVPNATVMVVENAERFGISQLHQLRGRIGRGKHRSSCLLMGPPGAARLRALVEHTDGFELAEIDLALRKEGELIGVRQSGIGQHRIACLPQDAPLLERARARAETIVAADPQLREPEHALLRDALERMFGAEALRADPEMRVIAGRYGGRRLTAPTGQDDTTDVRSCTRGTVRDARRRRGGTRAGSVRGHGRAGHRGDIQGRAPRRVR